MKGIFCAKIFIAAAVFSFGLTLSAGDNMLGLSLGDLYSTRSGDARVDTPERIERAVTEWSKMINSTALLWRVATTHIDHYEMEKTGYINWMNNFIQAQNKKFDSNKIGREVAHKLGMKFILNLSLYTFFLIFRFC